jgi:hypothetical protein
MNSGKRWQTEECGKEERTWNFSTRTLESIFSSGTSCFFAQATVTRGSM